MRLRLLLLLCLATVVIKKVDSSFVNSKWANVFKNFFGQNDAVVAPVEDSPLDEKDARIKRSILASLGAQINCEPGFTGQFCESPICNSRVIPPAIDAAAARLIDVFYLRQSCAGNVTFPLDSESQFLHIQVLTNEGELNGNVTLIDDQGNVVPCTTGCGGGQYNWPNAAPGQYAIQIYVASSNIIYCDVEVSTYTALAADVGFVNRPNEDAFEKGLAYNRPQYIVVHPYYLIQPATINAIYIFENQRDRTRYVSRLQPRYGCGYEYYTGEFQCDSTMISYRWVVEGIDYRGFLWRRAGTFSCAQQVTTSPPPTTAPPQPDYCMNGGTLYNNSNGISSCYCGEFFTGFNCANALCMNGGTPSFDAAICLCPGGYSGSHCADVQCQYDLIDNEYLTDKKSLIIVVRQSSAIQAQIPGIISSINMTVNMNFGGTEVFSNFILVVYGNNEALTTQYYASEFSSFLLALQLIGTGGAWSNNCTDDVIAGITSVFSALVIYHKSPIFVFTDVPPNDAADWRNVYEPNSFRKLPIYTFFLTDSTTLCYNQTDTLSQGYQTLQDISIVTGGLLFTPSVANYASLFRHTLIRTTYQANYITFNEMSKCSMSDRQSFIVDRSATNVYILATGINMALTITDPSWNVLNSTQLVSVVNDGRNFIWEFLDYTPGQYLYFIQSTGGGTNAPCSFRVVAKSNVDMFVGASAGLLGDMSLPDPVYGYSANMVVHFNGFVGRTIDPFRLFAEMQIDAWNRNQMFNQPIYYSSGIWRDGCKFHLYFGGFSCPVQEQRYIVTVFADDEVGYPIQRSWPAYCVPAFFNTNTTVPPNGQCFNGGVPNPMNASSCICPHNWTGQNCTIIVCDNNGTSMGSYCQCPALTEGPYCERLVCQSPQPGINFDAGNRALAFVLNVRSTMNNSLQDVANTAANLVRDLFVADGRYISYFIVATFNQAGGSVVSVTAANQYNLFIQSLNDAVAASNNQPAVDPSNCTGQISMAIVDVITNIRRLNLGQSQVFIYTDSDFGNITLTDAQALISAQDTSTTLNFVVTNYNLCGAPNGGVNGPSDLMKEMARGTAGLIYYTQHSGSIMGIIPTFYSSGLIAGAESSDCNANPIVYYLPIDGWSQSFLITALGAGVTISVTPPAGANMYDYLNEIDKDDYIHVNQYVIPCDATGMVTSKDQYCYIIHSVEKYSWYQSRDNCRKDEAYIVDIPTQEINDFFSVQVGNTALWIGLYRDPGTNQWHWDNYNYVNLTFNNNTDYSNWGDNEPSANGDCVVSKPNAQGVQKWYMDNCNATYSYMCQKHKYGQTIMPRDPSTNRLPPGIWQLKVSSNATGTNASCFFEARIQSQIQVYYGYVSDIHSDYPASYGNILTNGNYYAAHTTGLEPLNANNVIDQTDGHLNYALIFNPNGSLYYSATFQERRICTYPQISQGFACPGYKQTTQKTNFFVKFSGIDQYGNLFERYAATFCTGTTYCVNGYLSNGACICEAYWQGASCETPICLNGGTVNGGSCTCPAELGGPNCQYPNCQDPQKITFNDTGVTLAILLETSSKTGSTLFYLRNNLARIIANVTSNQVTSSQWISNYMLYPFDSASNEQYWYPPVVSNTFDAINTALNNISTFNGCPGPNGANGVCASGSSCPRPILRVLNNVLKDPSFKNPNSIVIIITASNIGDYGALNDVHETAETMRATINIIVVDSAAPCGNFSYTSPETTALYLLAQMTGGDFFYSSGKSVVANLLPYYLPTLYRTAHLGTIFVQNCSDETVYFPIDSGTQAFSVSYTGPGAGGLTMTVTDSNNTVVPLPEGYQLYEYTYFAAFDYLNTLSNPPGTWKLEVKSTARNCVLTVRLRSTIEVFAGFTNQTDSDLLAGALKDNPRALLAVDTPNGIILHANNLGNGTLNYVQIYGGGDRVLFSSELIKRIGCNYEWWAPSSFTCAYGLYIVSVSGIDRRGQNFIRNIPVQCTAPYPPPPTEPRCDTTQAVYDIALILDISTKASSYGASTWSDFTAALSRALGNYYPAGGSFSSAGTRLAIIGVAGIANTKLFNNFAESDGKKIADLLINVQQNQADYGQNLPSAITILQQLVTNPNSGYRSGAQYPNVRHLAIYATLNGAQTEGGTPADDVHSLRRSGVFGFAVVAYNATYSDTATKFNLETLASFPCLYFAIDSPINTYIPYYINDITCVRTPQCGEAAQNETGRFFLN